MLLQNPSSSWIFPYIFLLCVNCTNKSDQETGWHAEDIDGDGWDTTEDCDDTNSDIHPEAVEICGDGVDSNCDNIERDCAITVDIKTTASATFNRSPRVGRVGDFNGDGYADFVVAGDDTPLITSRTQEHAYSIYLFFGTGARWTDVVEPSTASARFREKQNFLQPIRSEGDINADGYSDLVFHVEYPVDDEDTIVYLLTGQAAGIQGDNVLESGDANFLGGEIDFYKESTASILGDTNGDGYDDILVGIPYEQDFAGTSFLFYGPVSGTKRLSDAPTSFIGEQEGEFSGWFLADVGDTNGDGSSDFMIGASTHTDELSYQGAAYLIQSNLTGQISLADIDSKFLGESAGDGAGVGVVGPGDIDGDGLADLLIGASGYSSDGEVVGAAYLVLSTSTDTTWNSGASLSQADTKFIGEHQDSHPLPQTPIGDFDGDQHTDICLSSYDNEDYIGATYIILGGTDTLHGTIVLDAADYKFVGTNPSDGVGSDAAGLGDIDADGHPDLLIGAYGVELDGEQAGAAYLLYGGDLDF